MDIKHPVIAFKLNATFKPNLTKLQLYDITRHSWKLGENRNKAKYAFAIYKGIVQEVYQIAGWLPQNSTMNTTKENDLTDVSISSDRWEFVGNIAPKGVRDLYLHKEISEFLSKGQNPVTYINC